MKLALAMGRTLKELREVMDAQEFGLWAALYEIDPWDHERTDVQTGIIAATIANYAGKMRKKGIKPALPADFMPFLQQQQQEEEYDTIDPLDYFKNLGNA